MIERPFTILLHSSKTMRPVAVTRPLGRPALIDAARQLHAYIASLGVDQIATSMHVSPKLAGIIHQQINDWTDDLSRSSPASQTFVGDIYSGLRASQLSPSDNEYADTILYILSGMYGVLRPGDGIAPYRLEPAYTFPDPSYKNMYTYWGDRIANQLPDTGYIINTSSVEYIKLITPYVDDDRIITPRFLTVNPTTGQPGFTAVHAKIARGAFARWLIMSRITDPAYFNQFDDLGYRYDPVTSTLHDPVFICETFGGLGLSVRLS
jgi:uncharacterized protein